jgi:SAM-dependent methyltransferase
MGDSTQPTASAHVQAELWAQRALDWADVMEGWSGWGIPVYRHVLEHVPVGPGTRLLDVGCGAGRFCRLAADRGAQVSGLDVTPALIEIARSRTPEGDFRVGDMEQLPWDDATFNVVTGFNSFFIAGSMENALREARRVLEAGGLVAMSVFGRPEHCDSTAVFKAVRDLFPPSPAGSGTPGGPPLHEPGALEAIAQRAGLTPQHAGYLEFEERYADLQTVLRGMTAAPPMIRAARVAGDDRLREAMSVPLRTHVRADGTCRLREEVRYLIARC